MPQQNQQQTNQQIKQTKVDVKIPEVTSINKVELGEGEEQKLLDQFAVEYKIANDYLIPKRTQWLTNLKLYNNQRKKTEDVGDPLLFTVFQTILASLYDDRLDVEWLPREEGDEEQAENLTALCKYDYDVMGKSIIDYDWIWDTLFFGRGLVLLDTFDRETRTPIPEVIDPSTFLRDPEASSVNGNFLGRNAMKYGGRIIKKTKKQMEDEGVYYNLDKIKQNDNINNLTNTISQARDVAQNRDTPFTYGNTGDNISYELIEWKTYWKGKKILLTVANDKKLIVRIQYIDNWNIIDRALYPTSHDFDSVSLPDLIGPNQRARAVMTNMAIKLTKADLYPMYVYDSTRIKNKADLTLDFNKAIESKGPTSGAIMPLNKATVNAQLIDYIMNTLDNSAQKATATPELQQGMMSKEQRTLGELNIVAAKVDTRFSLAAKVFSWSEKAFWNQWYWMYKKYFKEGIDEKILRIQGAFGLKWRAMKKENIITDTDPDVRIDSSVLAEAKRMKKKGDFITLFNMIGQDPTTNKRYLSKYFAKLTGFDKDEIERMLPPTTDEIVAEEENKTLNDDKLPNISVNDNHVVHLEMHQKANPTGSAIGHIKAHQAALRIQKEKPELFPVQQREQAQNQQNAQTSQQVAIPNNLMTSQGGGLTK